MSQIKVIFFNAGGTLIQLKDTTLPALYAKLLNEILDRKFSPQDIYNAFQKAENWVLSRRNPGALFSDLDQRKYQNVFYNHLGIISRREINRTETQLAEMLELNTKFVLEKDVKNVLDALSGYSLGIISNWDESLFDILDNMGIYNYFDSITISGDIGISKPDLAIFKSALSDFPKVKPKETVYIGDDYNFDIIPAQEMKMKAVLYDKGPTGMYGRPFHDKHNCLSIKRLKDFPKIIQKAFISKDNRKNSTK